MAYLTHSSQQFYMAINTHSSQQFHITITKDCFMYYFKSHRSRRKFSVVVPPPDSKLQCYMFFQKPSPPSFWSVLSNKVMRRGVHGKSA